MGIKDTYLITFPVTYRHNCHAHSSRFLQIWKNVNKGQPLLAPASIWLDRWLAAVVTGGRPVCQSAARKDKELEIWASAFLLYRLLTCFILFSGVN